MEKKNKKVSILKKEVTNLKEQMILYERQNKSYEDNFNMIKNAANIYATSWAGEGDFSEKCDNAKNLSEKILIVFAHLTECNAKKEDLSPKKNLTENTIVDAERHEFFIMKEEETSYVQIGILDLIRAGIDQDRRKFSFQFPILIGCNFVGLTKVEAGQDQK